MDSEFTTSCKIVQELRRTYLSGLKLTESNKKKLELALAKDPPRLADQEKYVLCGCGCVRVGGCDLIIGGG